MRWPDKIKPRKDDLQISVPDVMPTILSMMGLEKKIPAGVEGQNLKETIFEDSNKRPVFSLYLSCNAKNPKLGKRGLRNDRYTFAIDRDGEGDLAKYYLFDNKNDPYQMRNIADENPDLVKKTFVHPLYPRHRGKRHCKNHDYDNFHHRQPT